jgi:hypothetical protein
MEGRNGGQPFNKARIVGGLALLAVVVVVYVTGRPMDPIQLGLLLGTAMLLLGVEAGKRLLP